MLLAGGARCVRGRGRGRQRRTVRRRRRLRTPGGFGGVGGTAMMAGSATVAATMLVVVHPRPGLESSPSRSPRPRPKWRRAAERVGGVLFAGGGVLLR